MEEEYIPVEKRQKLSRRREIVLNLDNFPSWVEKASEKELIEVFNIGVSVKNSVSMNVSFKEDYIDGLLNEKLKPMSEAVESLVSKVSKNVEEMEQKTKQNAVTFENKVSSGIASIDQKVVGLKTNISSDMIKMEGQLIASVQEVAGKVPPLNALERKIDSVERNVSDKVKTSEDAIKQVLQSPITSGLDRCETKLNDMKSMYSKAPTKGLVGEIQVMEILKELKSHTIENVARESRKGDIHVTSPKMHKYLIEVKKHQKPVNTQAIEKFESEVQSAPDFRVGILLSLDSGIAKRASGRRFEIAFMNKQYFIYVPNVSRDRHLVTWSVLLADELVGLNHKIDHTKIDEVNELYKEFKNSLDRSKTCGKDLETLKRVVKSLEENLEPLLKIIDGTKAKLKAIIS